MKTYLIPLVPGPTRIAPEVLGAFQADFGSADLEPDFIDLYQDTQNKLRKIICTNNKFALMTGEAMVVLWGALKSCLMPGDKLLAVATGVFGHGIAYMARSIGCEVEVVDFEYDQCASIDKIEEAIKRLHPKMVTIVHCETPSGTINPIEQIGELIKKYSVPLYLVDAVSSAGGMELKVDDWNIDLCVIGSHKCFSAPPSVGIVSVSERAWKIIDYIEYHGYDALASWEEALEIKWFPYTPFWHAISALNKSCQMVLNEGLKNVYKRHQKAAEYCRKRIVEMGLTLFPVNEKIASPTVTAVKIPMDIKWNFLNAKLRARGMAVGGSLGKLAGKVFRIGHMGQQANIDLLEHGMDILEYVLLYR
jgi:aspartate aminotransferase-like enzyme